MSAGRLLRGLAAALLAASAACVHAGTGLLELPGGDGAGPITVFYPTAASDQPVVRGSFTLQMAPGAAPVRGNGRLVVISHGSGGAPWVHADLGHALVRAGFVVALPEHAGDNYRDFSTPGPESWKRRPAEVSHAIDVVGRDPRFAPLLALDKVGLYGGSAGGHTALAMAGGRWSPAAFRRHCEAHIAEDFSSCVGFTTLQRGNLLDPLKRGIALAVIRARFRDETWFTGPEPRLAAVVAAVPFAADFDMASFASPHVPLALVTAGRDVNQVPRFHSDAVLAACPACEHLAHMADGSHGIMLSPMPPLGSPDSVAAVLLADPPGFDRTQLAEVDARIAGFFRRHLSGGAPSPAP